MQWGDWELVIDVHPPVLRNGGYELAFDEFDGYWGMLGSVLDVYSDDLHERGHGFPSLQVDQLLAALHAVFKRGLDCGRTMRPAEAAYSYAAANKS